MKKKLQSITTIPFLTCLALLLLNDFYLKAEYHNWLTGKLSDFCGLYVFVFFWAAFFPSKKRLVYFSTALMFVLWKSSYSQPFIDFFSHCFYPIGRVVDLTDLIALSVLPISYYQRFYPVRPLRLNPIPFAFVAVFSFCAISVRGPEQSFEQPQYILFKSGIATFDHLNRWGEFNVFDYDSLVIIEVKTISLDKKAALEDGYHKVQILNNLDLRLARESQYGNGGDRYPPKEKLDAFKELRDSLLVEKNISIILNRDTLTTDHLNFYKSRLNGPFKRFFKDTLRIEGQFNRGVEAAVWTYYDNKGAVAYKKHFRYGELVKTESIDNDVVQSEQKFASRKEVIRDKYIHLGLIFLLMLGLGLKIALNYRNSGHRAQAPVPFSLILIRALGCSICAIFLSSLLSAIIPNAYTPPDIRILYDGFVFVICFFVFMFILAGFKMWHKFDWIYYILLVSLGIVFIEESNYLIN